MAHWFDRLSDDAVRHEDPVSRRDVLKAGGAGLVAGGILGSPGIAEASEGLADLLRASACRCQAAADRNYTKQLDGYLDADPIGGGLNTIYNPASALLDITVITGLTYGYLARKLACGTCDRSASGDDKPAPPKHQPPGGINPTPGGCAQGTVSCANSTTCCFAGDLCCPCRDDIICCVQAVGCRCCG